MLWIWIWGITSSLYYSNKKTLFYTTFCAFVTHLKFNAHKNQCTKCLSKTIKQFDLLNCDICFLSTTLASLPFLIMQNTFLTRVVPTIISTLRPFSTLWKKNCKPCTNNKEGSKYVTKSVLATKYFFIFKAYSYNILVLAILNSIFDFLIILVFSPWFLIFVWQYSWSWKY